jgi:hypothetical protein
MLKQLVRAGIRKARSWLQEGEKPQASWLEDCAYGRLNKIFEDTLAEGPAIRPHFAWGVLHGAFLAKNLGIGRISTIEFGVAGGNGLLSLERAASSIGECLEIEIDVYGFDTGRGLPKPIDYRDVPNLYLESAYPMNHESLRPQLKKARLLLGLVQDTINEFIKSAPAPVAFISFDMDYYSSTMHAFKLFDASKRLLLPRVHCYFDDIIGFTFSEFTGERLAITEFNNSHPMAKISPIFGLRHFLPVSHGQSSWVEQMFMAHFFDHELYAHCDGLTLDNRFAALTEQKLTSVA